MPVLFEVERFPLPSQNNILLETFLSIKEEILKAIEPIKEKIISTNSHIVVILTPKEIAIKYLVSDSKLADEINDLLSDKMDLSKIAKRLLSVDKN